MKKRNNRHKRGIAIEMAIGLMLLSVALSILLVSIAKMQITNAMYDVSSFEEKILSNQKESASEGQKITVNGKEYKFISGEFKPVPNESQE